MCACKDKACSEKVSDEYSMWNQTQAKSDGDKPGTPGEEDKKMEELIEELTQCRLAHHAVDPQIVVHVEPGHEVGGEL